MKISLQLIVLLQCHFWLEILMALFSASHLCFSCYFCSTIQLTWEPNLECLLWEFYWGSQCWHSFWPCDAKVGMSITHRWMDRSQHCLWSEVGILHRIFWLLFKQHCFHPLFSSYWAMKFPMTGVDTYLPCLHLPVYWTRCSVSAGRCCVVWSLLQ